MSIRQQKAGGGDIIRGRIMEAYEHCHDVIQRLKAAWRPRDASGSLQRAKCAFVDAASVLAPRDIRRLAVEASGHRPATEPTPKGQLTLERQLQTAHWCSACAELCGVLTYLVKHDEAVESLEVTQDLLNEGWYLVTRMWPEYLQTVARIPTEVPYQYAPQAEFIHLLLTFLRAFSEKLLLPFLDAFEFELLFINAITQIRDYMATEPLARDILQAAKQRDARRIASLVSQADTTDPHIAGVLSVLAFSLRFCRTSIAGDVLLYLCHSLAFRTVAGALQPRYYELAGGSSALDEIAQSRVDKHVLEKIEYSLPFDFRKTEEDLTQFIDQLCSALVQRQDFEIRLLKTREEIFNKCQPLSLDVSVEDRDGEVEPLSEMLPAPADLDEAMPQLLEILEKLNPQDAELYKERFLEGKSLEQINVERGWTYDRTQKRIERLTKDILNKMSN